MGISDRVSAATRQIQAQARDKETATARHTVYWRPADLDQVRDFANPNFLSIADTIRGAVRYALVHEADFLDFLRQERLKSR
jgi:hypothetical protein